MSTDTALVVDDERNGEFGVLDVHRGSRAVDRGHHRRPEPCGHQWRPVELSDQAQVIERPYFEQNARADVAGDAVNRVVMGGGVEPLCVDIAQVADVLTGWAA